MNSVTNDVDVQNQVQEVETREAKPLDGTTRRLLKVMIAGVTHTFIGKDRELRRARRQIAENYDAAFNALASGGLFDEDARPVITGSLVAEDHDDNDPRVIMGRFIMNTLLIPKMEKELADLEELYLSITDCDLEDIDLDNPLIKSCFEEIANTPWSGASGK